MVGSRVRSFLLGIAVFVLVAAAAAQAQVPPSPFPSPGKPKPAPTDQGNNASESVGVVQVGPVTVDPTSATENTPVADIAGSTEATVGDTGGNGASQSGGVVQAGGGNSATGSLGVAQVSHSKSQTTAHAQRQDTQATASVPTSIGGSGDNTANG